MKGPTFGSRPWFLAALICAALLGLHAWLARSASLSKCATMDEPLHAVSAYLSTFYGEYRVDSEDPPLWKYWAMLPNRAADLYVEREGSGWEWAIREPRNQSLWSQFILFQTTGIDGAAFIERSRMMFVIVSVLLGMTITIWTYKLYGPIASIAATLVFSLDPTCLAHGAIVKNDVSITLIMLLFIVAIYRAGKKLTWKNALTIAILLGVGMNVKYSGLLQLPMLGTALIVRILMSQPWKFLRWDLAARGKRTFAAGALMVMSLAIAWLAIWASYGCRFDAGPHGQRIDIAPILDTVAENRFRLHEHRLPKGNEAAGWDRTLTVRLALLAERARLLPQAWIAGFLFTYSSALVRKAYLLGTIYDTGRWYYFPLAELFKTPVATLVAMCAGLVLIITRLARKQLIRADNLWRVGCLLIPVIIYGGSALTSSLNIGIRHLLPIMPYGFILIGWAAAALYRRAPRVFAVIALILGTGLAAETFAAFPDYLAFFNVAVGGERAGLKLLGDSNLDWGQDLPALALWQQKHSDEPLYLIYFGRSSPEFYGIQRLTEPDRPCMMAISATTMQGIYLDPGKEQTFKPLWNVPPRKVLGGSIYMYRFPDDMPDAKTTQNIRELIQEALRGQKQSASGSIPNR